MPRDAQREAAAKIESWTAGQGMLDHWAFLAREGQGLDDPRAVLDADPVLDLLERCKRYLPARPDPRSYVGSRDTVDTISNLHNDLDRLLNARRRPE